MGSGLANLYVADSEGLKSGPGGRWDFTNRCGVAAGTVAAAVATPAAARKKDLRFMLNYCRGSR